MGYLSEPFLTDLDSRAQIKGSRDPIGAQAIWTRFGRHVVGNLTTVSNSVRDFTTTLLGYYVAEEIAKEVPGSELATFLKWEQLCAYTRAYYNRDFAFRGTERVRERLAESAKVSLSDASRHQILSDQSTYGLWGLYSVPSAASGLLEQDPVRLRPDALAFVDDFYLPKLKDAGLRTLAPVLDLLGRTEVHLDLAKDPFGVAQAVARVLDRRMQPVEQRFYRRHLVDGGPGDSTGGKQALLAQAMDDLSELDELVLSDSLVRAMAKEARRRGPDADPLIHRLDAIRSCESVLAPAAHLFAYLQGCNGKSIDVVAKRIKDQWGGGLRAVNFAAIKELKGELAEIRSDTAEHWIGLAESFSGGHYARAIELLIEQNGATMRLRGGAPWIEKRPDGLQVKIRDEQGALPARDHLKDLWRFPYFLDSLWAVTRQVSGVSHG